MKIAEIACLLQAQILCGQEAMDMELETAFGSDMMSDVLAFSTERSLLLTGLLNPQVVRTAEMLDICCIVFLCGKTPGEFIVELAEEKGISLLLTKHGMFSACGILHANGLLEGANLE